MANDQENGSRGRMEGHLCCSLAPGTRALGRASFDGAQLGAARGTLPEGEITSELGRSIRDCARPIYAVEDDPATPSGGWKIASAVADSPR